MSLRGNNHIKPAARRTVVFLLLGAILNVAVAWAACTPLQIKGLPGKAHILRRHDISEHYSHWLAKMPKDFILPSSMNFQSSNIGATRVFASNGGSLNIDSTRCTWPPRAQPSS